MLQVEPCKTLLSESNLGCPCGCVGADHYITEMDGEQDLCVFFTVIRFSIMGYSKQDDVFCVRAMCLLYCAVSNTVLGPNL